MVPGRPLREEEITTIPNHDRTLHTIMQQILWKTKQIRTRRRTEELEDSIPETEMESAGNNLEETAVIEVLEMTRRNLDSPAEYAQKPLTQTYLDVQSSKSIFQANQRDLAASLRKYVNYALEQCSVSVYTMV